MRKYRFLDLLDRFLGIVFGILAWLLLLLMFYGLVSCTKYRYIEMPETHYRDSIVVREARDSVYLHDSIFVSLVSKDDTIFVTKLLTKYKYKEVVRVDTLQAVRVDSVSVPVASEKEVYRMHRWQRFFFHLGLAVSFVAAFYVVCWLRKKWKKC